MTDPENFYVAYMAATLIAIVTIGVIYYAVAKILGIFMDELHAAVGGLCTAISMAIIFVVLSNPLGEEISTEQYAYVDEMVEDHPELAPIGRAAMNDGMIDGHELSVFRSKVDKINENAIKARLLGSHQKGPQTPSPQSDQMEEAPQ